MKKSLLFVAVIIITMAALLAGCGEPQTVSFSLVGDSVHGTDAHTAYEVWIDNAEIPLEKGDSAEDVVYKALAQAGCTVTGNGYISAVTSPDGLTLGEGSNGTQCGWMFAINGVIPPSAMADCFPEEGDSLLLRFVDDYNTDIDWTSSTFID